VVLYVYAILATLVFSAPFFILGFWGMYQMLPQVQAIPMNAPEQVLNVIFQNIPSILLILFSGLIILTVATIFFSYIYYLLTNIYKNYLDGQKLPIFSNHFFSWKHLWKCTGVIGWASGYLLVPILLF
jgi:flagellar biosynthesis protein FlhB